MEEHTNIVGMMFRCKADAALSITHADDGSRKVTGYTPAELVDTGLITLPDLIHPDDRDYARSAIQAGLSEKRTFVVHTRLQVKDRTKTDGILIGTGIFNGPLALTGLEGYIIRILSSPPSGQESGLLSPEVYLELLSHTDELIALLSPEGHILYVTPSVNRIMGYDQGAVTGLLFTQILVSQEQKRFEELKNQVLTGGGSSERFLVSLPDGQIRPVLIRLFKPGGLNGFIVRAIQIDEQAEETRNKESRFHDIFSRIPLPAIVTTSSELQIAHMNQAASTYASVHAAGGSAGTDIRDTHLISLDVIDQIREGLGIAEQVEVSDSISGREPVRVIGREIQSGDDNLIIWTLIPDYRERVDVQESEE